MSDNMTPKERERFLRERTPEAESLIKSLQNCDRRHFLKALQGDPADALVHPPTK